MPATESQKAASARYRQKNKAKIAAYNRAYFEKNKESEAARCKAYNDAHKEEKAVKDKAKRAAMSDEEKTKDAARAKVYREENKEEMAAKAKIRSQTPAGRKIVTLSCWRKRNVICDDWDALYEKYLTTTHCELCQVELTTGKRCKTTRCLDHNHDTHLFRNVLCHSCNVRRG
mgnify:CR=1 FL=1